MITVNGRFTEAKIYAKTALPSAIDQIQELTDQPLWQARKFELCQITMQGRDV